MRQAVYGLLTVVVCAVARAAAPAPSGEATAPAEALLAWTRAPAPKTDAPVAPPGPEARAALETLLQRSLQRTRVGVAWARVVTAPKKAGPALVLLAADSSFGPDGHSRREGLLAVVSIEPAGAALRDKQRIPLPETLTWKFRPATDVDGDKVADLVAEWAEAGPKSKRSGIAIARTAPAGLTFLELDSDHERAGRRHTATADVACFLPVTGSRGQALVIQRHTATNAVGRDGLQVLLPQPNGRYADGRVYAAVFDFEKGEGERRWRDVFSLRDPKAATRQSVPGACPADGVLVRSGALGSARPDALSIFGPLAASAMGVEQAVRRFPKAPRAVLVVSLGE